MTERPTMDKQYSVQFFTSFLESLQEVCRTYLNYSQFVEVSGYVCVEIDNMKKERYVLSELLQSSGNVVSESYCTKACMTQRRTKTVPQISSRSQPLVARTLLERNRLNRGQAVQRTVSNYNLPKVQQHSKSVETISGCSNRFVKDKFVSFRKQNTSVPNYKQNIKQTSGSSNQQYAGQNQQQTYRPNLWDNSSDLQSHPNTGSNKSAEIIDNLKTECEGTEVNVSFPSCFTDKNDERPAQLNARTDEEDLGTDQESQLTISSCHSLQGTYNPEPEPVASVAAVLDDDVIDLDLIEDEDGEVQQAVSSPMEEDASQDIPLAAIANIYQVPKFASDVLLRGQNVMSPGSKHVMKSALKQFQRYHFEKSGQDVDLFATSPEELNDMLLDFYKGGRTLNGKELTPGSLKNVQIYLDKYLREGGYLYSISKDDHFKSSRDFIKAKVNDNSRQIVTQRHIPVNDHDIEVLFQNNQLGSSNPDTLTNTMWILNTRLFAIKGPTEHFNLKWGDITLSTDSEGREYLERPTRALDAYSLKVFSNPHNPERCFVSYYKAYRAVRPKLMMDAGSSFYLKASKIPIQDAWYLPEALSWSSLTNLWKRMVVGAGLPINKKIF